MNKGKRLFSNVENYKDLKSIISNNLDNILGIDHDILKNGLLAINKEDSELNDKIMAYSQFVDRKLTNAGTNNKFRKLPTIIIGSLLMNKYDVGNLTMDELSILSNHLVLYSYNEIDEILGTYNKETLGVISSKTKDYEYQEELMILADFKEGTDIVNYINTGNLDELVVESHKLQEYSADNFKL